MFSLNCLTTLAPSVFFYYAIYKNKAYPNEAEISYLWSSP